MEKRGVEIVSVEEVTDANLAEKCPWITKGEAHELNNADTKPLHDGTPGGEQHPDPAGLDSLADPERGSWGGQFEFLLTCIGYAVGLGNVWRFPYLCYKNGGGAFLIPYTFMLAAVGLPLFFLELAFGQFASLGPISIWRINPLLKGLGYGMVMTSWLIGLYYNVVISYIVFYLYASLTSFLPWTNCDNDWNTDDCVGPKVRGGNSSVIETSVEMKLLSNLTTGWNSSGLATTASVTGAKTVTAAEEYYKRYVLEMSNGIEDLGHINWKLAACLLFSWLVVGAALLKGVQSLGKVVYFTALFPYLMLTILLIRGVTLEGAGTGIAYYLKPNFEKLKEPRVWSDAATQIFYSLSACSGGLIAMSSYNKFSNNCYRDALIVSILNCSTSIYAGFVIFSILGFMAREKGVAVSEVAKHGPGLAFEVYPEALSQLPVPPLWSVFFFLMMATLGFGSQFSIVECVISAFIDEFRSFLATKKHVIYFRVGVIVLCFLLGLPMVCSGGFYLLSLIDFSVGGFPLLIIGLVEIISINWIYGFEDFWGDVVMMIGEKPKIYWKATWLVVSPLVIFLTVLFNVVYFKSPEQSDGVPYPDWAIAMGWLIALAPVVCIPAWFFYKYCTEGGWQLLKLRSLPLPSWGPALATNRTDRYDLETTHPRACYAATTTTFSGTRGEEDGADRPIHISNARDLLQVLGPGEFARLMGSTASSFGTAAGGSNMTLATTAGGSTVWGSKGSM